MPYITQHAPPKVCPTCYHAEPVWIGDQCAPCDATEQRATIVGLREQVAALRSRMSVAREYWGDWVFDWAPDADAHPKTADP